MIEYKRAEKILDILKRRSFVTTQELQDELYCSISTIRRDLIRLEEEGLIIRVRGGAKYKDTLSIDYTQRMRVIANASKKQHIAKIASQYIRENSLIFLDASTTVSCLCPYLIPYKNLTVVTNSLTIAMTLNEIDAVSVIMPGGNLQNLHGTLLGAHTISDIRNFKFDIAFLSSKCFDLDGVYEANNDHAVIKSDVITLSKEALLLNDSSKFNQSSFFHYAPLKFFTALISDPGIEPYQERLSQYTTVKF